MGALVHPTALEAAAEEEEEELEEREAHVCELFPPETTTRPEVAFAVGVTPLVL